MNKFPEPPCISLGKLTQCLRMSLEAFKCMKDLENPEACSHCRGKHGSYLGLLLMTNSSQRQCSWQNRFLRKIRWNSGTRWRKYCFSNRSSTNKAISGFSVNLDETKECWKMHYFQLCRPCCPHLYCLFKQAISSFIQSTYTYWVPGTIFRLWNTQIKIYFLRLSLLVSSV